VDPISRARLRYRLTHWGDGGEDREPRAVRLANPSIPFTELGDLVLVVYRTKKLGDGGVGEYEHKFRRPRPVLGYHEGGLAILGGDYRVTWKGIEG
jgi:hypothetical protein